VRQAKGAADVADLDLDKPVGNCLLNGLSLSYFVWGFFFPHLCFCIYFVNPGMLTSSKDQSDPNQET